MPTDTPSPHRFLAPRAAATQQSKQKPQSGLRNVLAIQTPKSANVTRGSSDVQLKNVTPARRFVIPPTRPPIKTETSVTIKEKGHEAWADTSTQDTPLPKPRRKFERVESIQDSSQSSILGTQDEGDIEGVIQSVEQDSPNAIHTLNSTNEDANQEEMLFAHTHHHKRRRLSPSSPSAPKTPLPPQPPTSHRFKAPPQRTPAPFPTITSTLSTKPIPDSHTTPAPAYQRPHFILPPHPTSPPKLSKPLPEIFSPSRKHGKYIPDGLAANMTSLIIETAGTGFAAQERSGLGGVVWGREREDGVKLRVRVTDASTGSGAKDETQEEVGVECFSGGVVFVKGEAEHERYNASRAGSLGDEDGLVRVLLAGLGGARGAGGVRVQKGGVVGIREPVWEVSVGEERWRVGVDWVVL